MKTIWQTKKTHKRGMFSMNKRTNAQNKNKSLNKQKMEIRNKCNQAQRYG